MNLIANSGIQMLTFSIKIDRKCAFKMLFHEWFDPQEGLLKLEIAENIPTEDENIYVKKYDLFKEGYLVNLDAKLDWDKIIQDGIKPLRKGDEMCQGVRGDIFKMSFTDSYNKLSFFENKWLPIPYFPKRTERRFMFGPFNWSRFKLIPQSEKNGITLYDILLAFDTRTYYFEKDEYNETPVFLDNFEKELKFSVCKNEFLLMDYCSTGKDWSYINDYIMKLVYPESKQINKINENFKYSYIASYVYLINYIAQNNIFPKVTLFKEKDTISKDVDMVIDVGNSRTTAILIEDNKNFNQISPLELQDYSIPIIHTTEANPHLNIHNDPFDMRLAFRKVDFGHFAIKNSKQFVYPSLVRLGKETNWLIHNSVDNNNGRDSVSTYSSPKRYLWDNKPNKFDWEFTILPKEDSKDTILNLTGITNQLKEDGSIDPKGQGGKSYHYSRRSLMSFSFLEMLVQAKNQINSHRYRKHRGSENAPRKIKRIIITCPTAMSEVERRNLIQSAREAVILLNNFDAKATNYASLDHNITVIPAYSKSDEGKIWYYDEATCSQLVYMYAEISQRYGCYSKEFFRLYGKKRENEQKESLIIGSLDIGAGTSDLMICKYDYTDNEIVEISPDPLFYDSFYFAGDDMLNILIFNLIIVGENSAIRKRMNGISEDEYKKIARDFFGPDYNGQSFSQRMLRGDFNIQISVPLASYFLELLTNEEKIHTVRFQDVFRDNPPSKQVLIHFRDHFGFNFESLEWIFDLEKISSLIKKAFEPLLNKIATIMYAYSCDIVILSGRPTSLPPIEEIFYKYYPVTPNRLIILNKYHIGHWYPFGNNTGYISNPKTVVAVGAMIGYYATELANLNGFTLSLGKMGEKLKSTANYLLNPNPLSTHKTNYFLTPETNIGTISLTELPININVKQLDIASYRSRSLFRIDFNRYKMAQSIRKKYEADNIEVSISEIENKVNAKIEKIMRDRPLKFTIKRGFQEDEKENLSISNVVNKNGEEVDASIFEINIQSIENTDSYWLDTGVFNF
ncbi:hypothetical protein EZS27_007269 [termite gut metagenome]|uniref:Virulence factor SrfB n=1 Tax=termite gut metagenome TaxID=433724 RepID=A0A5J4SIQ4_9ZZZZ